MTPFEFDMALQRPVFAMMRRGIKINQPLRAQLLQEYQDDYNKWQANLNLLAGKYVNTSSPLQMKNFLYTELGLPLRHKNKKVTTDEDAIRASMAWSEDKMKHVKSNELRLKWQRAFLSTKVILKIRGIRKIVESYLDINIDDDGRIRCTISVGGTETMRFSHSKTLWGTGLNLATIPHKLRTMFIPDEGYELAEFDLNRGESWVYSYKSMDPELIRIHSGGLDFHAETAAAIQTAFGAGKMFTADEIRKLAKEGDVFGFKIRYLGKKVNHASAYRMGPFRAAEVINEEADDTGITVVPAQMKKAQKLWLGKYPGIETWWNAIDKELESTRKLHTPYGRTRDFFGFMSDHLKKEATAYVPQSTSVDYLNRGMLRVFDDLVAKDAFGLELLHQNHDSILVQYPIHHREEVVGEVKTRLLSVVNINGHNVSIPVDASVGQNWGDYHKDRNPDGLRELKAA